MAWIKVTCFIFTSYFIHTQACYIVPFTWYLFTTLGLLSIAWCIATFMHSYIVMPNLPHVQGYHRSVLITGCDSGFGYLTALKLNSLGFYVFATCLNGQSEGALKLPVECDHPRRLKVLELDVTNDHHVARVVKEVERKETIGIKFHALINNAGITSPGPIEWSRSSSVVDYMQVLDVNLLGPLRMSRAFAHLLRKTAPGTGSKKVIHSTSGIETHGGRIINISSEAARTIAYGQVSYCVSKAALSKLTEGLSVELSQFGIRCISIEPYFYRTQAQNVEYFAKILTDKWHESSKDVQLNYGVESLEESLILQKYLMTECSSVSENVQDVPNLIVEAVTSFEPDSVYSCTPLGVKMLLCIMSLVPWDWYYLVNSLQVVAQKVLVLWVRKKGRRGKSDSVHKKEAAGAEEVAEKRRTVEAKEREEEIDGESLGCKMDVRVNASRERKLPSER